MSDEVKCKHCSAPISPQADVCPKCGHPQGLLAQPMGFSNGVFIVSLAISAVIVFGLLKLDGPVASWLSTFGLALVIAYAWKNVSKK
jgi:hypothetical protein